MPVGQGSAWQYNYTYQEFSVMPFWHLRNEVRLRIVRRIHFSKEKECRFSQDCPRCRFFKWIRLFRSSRREVLCKKRCSWKFRKIHRKTPVPDSLCNFIRKETLAPVFSSEFCEISKKFFLQNTSGGCFWTLLLMCSIGTFQCPHQAKCTYPPLANNKLYIAIQSKLIS